MPSRNTDLNTAIAQLVAEEVQAALWPYRATLDRMLAFFDLAPASRQQGTSGRGRQRPVRRRQDRLEQAADPVEKPTVSASPEVGPSAEPELGRTEANPAAENVAVPAGLQLGQMVTYRQGRGIFEAKVVELAGETVTLERTKDRARVKRPASKVIAGP